MTVVSNYSCIYACATYISYGYYLVIASYPGHVVGRKSFLPTTWPGYEARVVTTSLGPRPKTNLSADRAMYAPDVVW